MAKIVNISHEDIQELSFKLDKKIKAIFNQGLDICLLYTSDAADE